MRVLLPRHFRSAAILRAHQHAGQPVRSGPRRLTTDDASHLHNTRFLRTVSVYARINGVSDVTRGGENASRCVSATRLEAESRRVTSDRNSPDSLGAAHSSSLGSTSSSFLTISLAILCLRLPPAVHDHDVDTYIYCHAQIRVRKKSQGMPRIGRVDSRFSPCSSTAREAVLVGEEGWHILSIPKRGKVKRTRPKIESPHMPLS